MAEVRAGQFWLVDGGDVALVIKDNESTGWVCKKVTTHGDLIKNTGVLYENFEEQISAEKALRIATSFMKERIKDLFEL